MRYFKKHFEDQEQEITTVKINQPSSLSQLEYCITAGRQIIILNCGNVSHPALVAVIKKEI